jgi:NADPH-dependent 2,4-dienoyl-CoA reductase/sulfur reductase-like enzyme
LFLKYRFLKFGIELGKGIKVNQFLETSVQNIYAIGDCAEQRETIGLRRPIEAVWYTGRMMGEVLNINGNLQHTNLGTGSIQQNF